MQFEETVKKKFLFYPRHHMQIRLKYAQTCILGVLLFLG